MCDLMVLAFQADVTRVCTFVLANEGSNKPYPFIGVPEGHHDLSHHGNDAKKKEKIREINTFHATQLAYLLEKLKGDQGGDGTLLDHCMIAYGSGNSRRQRPQPRRPADPAGRRRLRHDQAGPARPLREGNAAEQPLALDARPHGREGVEPRRQHGQVVRADLSGHRS